MVPGTSDSGYPDQGDDSPPRPRVLPDRAALCLWRVRAVWLLLLLRAFGGGECCDERLLGDLDAADHLHPLLALLLLLQQLALAGDVAAVALGQHVLADGADVLPCDHPRPDRRLDRHLELLPRDELAQLPGQHHPVAVGRV